MSDEQISFPGALVKEEMWKLPAWAQVAFAARCARRVQPLCPPGWPSLPNNYFGETIRNAIELTEQMARKAQAHHFDESAVAASQAVANSADHIRRRFPSSKTQAHVADAAFSALYSARAASINADLRKNPPLPLDFDAPAYADDIAARLPPPETALIALAASADAAAAVLKTAQDTNKSGSARIDMIDLLSAMRSDFELLLWMTALYEWNENTPVDVNLLGPLWTNGEPDWWPEEWVSSSEPPPILHLEFSIPDGIDKDEADRLVGEIIQRSNELHHAMGGNGLKFEDGCVYESESALVPAGEDDGDWGGRQ